MQVLDDIDLKFKLATSGVGEHFAEDLASGARRPQRSSAYSLLKQVFGPTWALGDTQTGVTVTSNQEADAHSSCRQPPDESGQLLRNIKSAEQSV